MISWLMKLCNNLQEWQFFETENALGRMIRFFVEHGCVCGLCVGGTREEQVATGVI